MSVPYHSSQQLASRVREVFLDGTWIAGTNYKDTLTTITQNDAVVRIANRNSIELLARHVHYYVKGVKDALVNGQLTIKDANSFDFITSQNQDEWQCFLKEFWADVKTLTMTISQLTDQQLTTTFFKEEYGTVQRNLDGLVEHAYYHLGQIVLLKKMIDAH